jgi:formylglycine-generating enzyme required for sulfatase activity
MQPDVALARPPGAGAATAAGRAQPAARARVAGVTLLSRGAPGRSRWVSSTRTAVWCHTAVGGLRPNGYGLYDITGNVWAWVLDRVGPPPGAAGGEVDPTGLGEVPLRGLRGGGWYDPPRFAQLTTADGYRPETRSEMVGVRLVRTGR